ncbi:MAG: SCO family protein [Cellvibrionales bacterium]|jgi:protein SCO1/2
MTTQTRVWLTVGAILLFIVVILVSFVNRIQQPRIMSASEMQANGLYAFETPRDFGDFQLVDHRGDPFTPNALEGRWTLLFFGFTHCPDICPTTMSFLARLVEQLDGTEAANTQVVLVTVDPARDTPETLADYVPYFDPDFLGVTGEFIEILGFARSLNAPFRKVTADDGSYQVDHSANVMLINPRGHFHGFFKAPLDLAKVKVTYRSARYLWEH